MFILPINTLNMTQSDSQMSSAKSLLFQKQGVIFRLSYHADQKSIHIFIVNEADKVVLETKLCYQELDYQTRFLFESNESLFKYLQTLRPSNFKVVQGIKRYYLLFSLLILEKSKTLLLPINNRSKRLQNATQSNNIKDEQAKTSPSVNSMEKMNKKHKKERGQLKVSQQVGNISIKSENTHDKQQNSKKRQNPYYQQICQRQNLEDLSQIFKELRTIPKFIITHSFKKIYKLFQLANNTVKLLQNKKSIFESARQLPQNQKTTFSIKIITAKFNRIIFGVAVDIIKYLSEGSYYRYRKFQYKLQSNTLQDDQRTIESVPQIKKGQALNFTIDPRNYTMQFWVDGAFRIKRIMGDAFRNQKFYPFISMEDGGDMIEFI